MDTGTDFNSESRVRYCNKHQSQIHTGNYPAAMRPTNGMEDMNSCAGGALCKIFSGMYNVHVVTFYAREKVENNIHCILAPLKHKNIMK